MVLTACGAKQEEPSSTQEVEPSEAVEATAMTETTEETTTTAEETTEETTEEPEPPVIYANQIENGNYEIEVDSSSSMFRVVECTLNVEDESMTADMTMSGQGYGFVYMGTRQEADADTEEHFIPFVLREDGLKTFTVPVEALNMELDCAAWSIRKEKWYDRTLVFESELLPAGSWKE